MEAQRKNRRVLRSAVTRYVNELQSLLVAVPKDIEGIQVAWNMLLQKYEDLRAADAIIYAGLLEVDTEEQDLVTEVDECDIYIRKFTHIKVKCEKLLVEDRASGVSVDTHVSNGAVHRQSGKRTFKLPVIEFKKFDGNIKDWLPFWGQFKKVHEATDIDENDKIDYLTQATVSGSRARQLVDSFPALADNYEKIVDSLKARFGREDLQIEVYVRGLLRLILVNATSSSRPDISSLYDELETQLRALDTLGITSGQCSAIIFPLIESCLPEDLLRVWQRLPNALPSALSDSTNNVSTLEDRLQKLMAFLKAEVENEQRITLAAEGFGLRSMTNLIKRDVGEKRDKQMEQKRLPNIPTAAGLINSEFNKCIFCEGSHESAVCFKAQKMSMEQKKKRVTEKRACYCCIKVGHLSKKCKSQLKCILCNRKHVVLMCPNLPNHQRGNESSAGDKIDKVEKVDQTLSNQSTNEVLLQTLHVNIETTNGLRSVRALIDSGSQRSYILKTIAASLGYGPKRKETINHGLFGGSQMTQTHNCYDIKLVKGSCTYEIEVLDQKLICQGVSSMSRGLYNDELKSFGIQIKDAEGCDPIELLIGADFAGALYTGRREILKSGVVAMETVLGWTLLGKSRTGLFRTNMTFSGLVKDTPIAELWDLDVLGIKDPIEKKSREESALSVQKFFLDTVTINNEGRYEVKLPWLVDHPALPTNFEQATKRLETTVRKLRGAKLYEAYDDIFKLWLSEGIIEEVTEPDSRKGHYLPHRPVIKDNSTTRIRPVFDASARDRSGPSLNHCLDKGVNLIELIPSIILRFREFKIGVIADIRKAFLQISLSEEDRDFLKFLWLEPDGTQRVYRHRRVVFGISSSPFLLGATINYHLMKSLDRCMNPDIPYTRETLLRLKKSFYVDNCTTSVPDEDILTQFIKEASTVMTEASFDLRGWEYNSSDSREAENVSVLGLNWHLRKDTLTINMKALQETISLEGKITKRKMLSAAQQLFDPIGFLCPTTMVPKLLLQRLWKTKLSWDEVVDEETATEFCKWIKELQSLMTVEIPRWAGLTPSNLQCWSLHTFCDASEKAFAAVVFLRIVQNEQIIIRLLAAKARVAPLKKVSVPRLELLAATIGSRLCVNVKETLSGQGHCYFWSDSTTVISWIRKTEEWSIFVRNRVTEIRNLTPPDAWMHVPGVKNPADLPSRGCSPKQLLNSRWWEGPEWLYQSEEKWPQESTNLNEEEINQERLKGKVTSMLNNSLSEEWHLTYFSSYNKILRMVGWLYRLAFNIKNRHQKRSGELMVVEINTAETFVLKLIQSECFHDENDKRLCTLKPFRDKHGLLRVKTQMTNRQDKDDFRFPVILPAQHVIVNRLICEYHRNFCHVGVQGLTSLLREKYWILGGRRTVRSAISKCVVCKRQSGKPFTTESTPLIEDRVRDAVPFAVTGVDFAGPLYLKSENKVWICLFTCAVYRAIHLELVTSLSTNAFIQALRRFVARRGRPKTIYSDNGTNFVGAESSFGNLDWDAITRCTAVQRIVWKFNPPSAPWWGGFWERLIGLLKQLLRRVLGRASLDFESLCTVMCDCESVINSRPLTYVSHDPTDCVALTPAMFLREQNEHRVLDCDAVEEASFSRKIRYLQKLREDLRHRFRNEYLGTLKLVNQKRTSRSVSVGEVVLIGNDVNKRSDWPLARVMDIIPGRDGKIRLARVNTAKGQLLRPIQRLYPLEAVCFEATLDSSPGESDDTSKDETVLNKSDQESAGVSDVKPNINSRVPDLKVNVTRSGRRTRKPGRYLP